MYKNWILFLISLIFLAGCKVTPSKQPLNEPLQNKQITVYSLIEQDELEALYPVQDSSAATMQFGLVGALVGSALDGAVNASNASEANENLIALRNELIEFNFDKIFAQELNDKLAGNLQIKNVINVKNHKDIAKGLENNEIYLVLNTHYKLEMDFRTPFITSYVTLHKADKEKTILYKNNFTYFGHSLPPAKRTQVEIDQAVAKVKAEYAELTKTQRKKIEEISKYNRKLKKAKKETLSFEEKRSRTAKAWTADYKGKMETNLRVGIQDLFTIIADDIKDNADPISYQDSGEVMSGYPAYHKSLTLNENNERKVIRFTYGARNGAVCSMPAEQAENKIVCL